MSCMVIKELFCIANLCLIPFEVFELDSLSEKIQERVHGNTVTLVAKQFFLLALEIRDMNG